MPEQLKNILVVRLSAIGDVIRTIPAVNALRAAFPDSRITWVVEEKARDVVDATPSVDETIIYPRKRWAKALKNPLILPDALREIIEFRRLLKSMSFDAAFDFHGNMKSGLISFVSGAHLRVGYSPAFCKELNHLFSNRKVTPRAKRINRHEKNLALVEEFAPNYNNLKVELEFSGKAGAEVADFAARLQGDGPLIAVFPGSSRPMKKWPASHFADLAKSLAGAGYRVMALWGPSEEEDAMLMKERVPEAMVSPPTGSLSDIALLIREADVFVGCDTGPMHLASALGVPVAGIFGCTDPAVNGPYREPCRVIYHDLECSPCRERGCDRDMECLRNISVNEVRRAVDELLEGTTRIPPVSFSPER